MRLLQDNCVRIELKTRFCAGRHVRISVKQWPHNFMLQSDWLMLYYSGSKILVVACQCQTDTSTGLKASGPLMGH